MSARAVPRIVVMGVSAVGKSTVGRLLAESLGVPFVDGDDLHPDSSIRKMASGTPLDDRDRIPWLHACGRELGAPRQGAVIACSALTRPYRDIIRGETPEALFVHLHADEASISSRATGRSSHFMPSGLLASQLATLRPLDPDERGITVDAGAEPAELVEAVCAKLRDFAIVLPGQP
ncbi:gluconokinase [Microbacterium sp. NPDC003461]